MLYALYDLILLLCALPAYRRQALCGFNFMMKEEKEELEETKELFKEGLKKIFKATKKVTEKVVDGFKEGYAEDVTKKEK